MNHPRGGIPRLQPWEEVKPWYRAIGADDSAERSEPTTVPSDPSRSAHRARADGREAEIGDTQSPGIDTREAVERFQLSTTNRPVGTGGRSPKGCLYQRAGLTMS